uniref:Ig-like domain-containing protein n=1 Tax=Oreochromis aureus TaxID=47969 RepID=A0A668VI69_OREAU
MERMRQNDSDPHVLQWMHGCEGETQPDGTLRFVRGMDNYAYDGDDFLSFDDRNGVWIASAEEALPTKRKWDGVQVLREYTKGYLENECIDWLSKFVNYGKQQLKKKSPPNVYVLAKKAKLETNLILTCLATGFHPDGITVMIRRNEEEVLKSSEVLPNNDDTFQIRDRVEILRSDLLNYSCEVVHEASGVNVSKVWDRSLLRHSDGGGASLAAVLGLVLLALVFTAVVLVVLYKRGIFGRCGHCAGVRSESLCCPLTWGPFFVPRLPHPRSNHRANFELANPVLRTHLLLTISIAQGSATFYAQRATWTRFPRKRKHWEPQILFDI